MRKALLQAKLETGGTVKANSPLKSDYKEKLDQLKSKTQELKKQEMESKQQLDSFAASSSSLYKSDPPEADNFEVVANTNHSVDTVSEDDEYVRVNVHNNNEEGEDSNINYLEKVDEVVSEVEDDTRFSPREHKRNSEEMVAPSMSENISESIAYGDKNDKDECINKEESTDSNTTKPHVPEPANESVPDGDEFRKCHAVFTVAKDINMTKIFNVWVPFNCNWDELTEAVQKKVDINSNKSILKMVLTEYSGDVLSPDIKSAVKFFKIYQNFEPGNSTFVLTIDSELEAQLQAAKDLAAFRAAALRLTFINSATKDEKFVYVNRNFNWDEILSAIVLEFQDIAPHWIKHIVMFDADGDELSPPITSVDKFWKFTRTASMHNGDIFVFHLDEEKIAEDREIEARKAFLASCREIKLQIKDSDNAFSALVPLNGEWDTIRSQISQANPELICDPNWIIQLLLVDSEGDSLSPNIDGDAMFWKVFPTYTVDSGMKYIVFLDSVQMEEYARVKALEEYRARCKHLRISLANDQSAEVGDIYVPHQCEWKLLTEGVADFLKLSDANWIDYFVLLDHEHDPISPPLKNITMFWKACENFSIEKNMVLSVFLKPEAINTLQELAFLSKANSFRVRLADPITSVPDENADADSSDHSDEDSEEVRVYVNPDSNWKDMATAIAQALHLDSYEWIENVVLIDEEGDVLSPFIKTTEKFWRFYKKSLDKSIFLVNQDEALKAGAIANRRKKEEEAIKQKKERERMDRAGMKAFKCMVLDHEVEDSVPPVECSIRVHSSCDWDEILQSIDETGVTESTFVKYLLLVDSSGNRLSVPIKDSKLFWKFAPSAERGDEESGNYFEIHLDFQLRTQVLRDREKDRIRNSQKKIEVASAVGDQSSVVLLFSSAVWDDVANEIIKTCGYSDEFNSSCIKHLILYDIDGDQLSPTLSTTESFWGTYHTIYQFDRNMQFVVTLDQAQCEEAKRQKAHEEFVRNAFKFKICEKANPSVMKDVLVAPKALWQDVVKAISSAFFLDSPTWVHYIVLLDGEGDPLSRNINDTNLFWKTAACYQYDESKHFELVIDSQAVEATKKEQAYEAFMNAAEHIPLRAAPVSANSKQGTLHAIFDSPWPTVCKAIIEAFDLKPSSKITHLTLIDEDLDELSPSVSTAAKFWKIYKYNFKHDSGMSFAVGYDDSATEDESQYVNETVNSPYHSVESNVNAQPRDMVVDDVLEYEGEKTTAAVEESIPQINPEDDHQYQMQDVQGQWSSAEMAELEATYLQACASKDIDQVVMLVEQQGVNPLAVNKNMSTAAHFACSGGCPVELIMKLHEYGVDLNSFNVSGARPISCAVIAGDVELCRCLLHCCPEIDLNFAENTFPVLHHAVDSGNIEMLMWLHEMQVDPNIVNPSGVSAVLLCVETTPFSMDVLRYLVIEMGADIFMTAPGKYSPLHAAASSGNLQAAEFFNELGLPVDCATVEGKTPLMFACSQGNLEMAKLLHSQGASLYSCGGKTDKLNTSLHLAAQFGHLDIVKWLVADCRLNPSPRNSRNAAPVDFARAANKMEVYQWLSQWVDAHPDAGEASPFTDGSYEALEDALFRNDFPSAIELLDKMSGEFTKDTVLPHGTTPLHFVAAAGYMDLAKYLVQEGCDVNVRSDAGRTPIHYASFKGHTDMCMYLYECGASLNEIDNGGLNCSKIAEQNNYQTLSMWLRSISLKDKGASKMPKKKSPVKTKSGLAGFFSCVSSAPEATEQSTGREESFVQRTQSQNSSEDNDLSVSQHHDTHINRLAVQLHEACMLGDLSLARDLVENEKAPVNGSPNFPNPLLPSDEQELTPLHGAVSSGNLPLVQFLVNKGAYVNAQNVGGLFNKDSDNSEAMTPLHIACDKQHEGIVMYLVAQGADLYKKNMAGDTSLHIICLLGLSSLLRQIVDLPRSTLPDLNLDVRSSHLLNLLHCAADAGSVETAKILIENNVGVNSFDDEKKTPMHYACAKGSLSMVKLLVDNGAIVDLADTSGRTPFLFASSADNIDLLKYLSERGAQIDYESAKGNTALHIACKFGRLELVKWLVENGLKIDHINSSGHSPLHYAQINGFNDVVDWLESI